MTASHKRRESLTKNRTRTGASTNLICPICTFGEKTQVDDQELVASGMIVSSSSLTVSCPAGHMRHVTREEPNDSASAINDRQQTLEVPLLLEVENAYCYNAERSKDSSKRSNPYMAALIFTLFVIFGSAAQVFGKLVMIPMVSLPSDFSFFIHAFQSHPICSDSTIIQHFSTFGQTFSTFPYLTLI